MDGDEGIVMVWGLLPSWMYQHLCDVKTSVHCIVISSLHSDLS